MNDTSPKRDPRRHLAIKNPKRKEIVSAYDLRRADADALLSIRMVCGVVPWGKPYAFIREHVTCKNCLRRNADSPR